MKEFLEKLKTASMNTYDVEPDRTKARQTLRDIRNQYLGLENRRAILTSKVSKDTKVVYIRSVGARFLTLVYPYYGDISGEVVLCVTYGSLFCGDEYLEVE